jgi:putative oxidoreductase
MTMIYTAEPPRTNGFMIFIQSIASLVLRIALAIPFFLSGLTKWHGPLKLNPAAEYLFGNQFQLHLPSDISRFWVLDRAIPMPYPDIAVWLSAFGEILLPAAIVIGFATRLSALGILAMAAVIFLVYPETWRSEQLPWAAMALALVAYGPGRISFDWFIWRGFRRR